MWTSIKLRSAGDRILAFLSPNLHWRLMCPDTIEGVAQDFITNHLPGQNCLREIDFHRMASQDPGFAWRRRISAIYGVATCYQHPRGDLARAGWNRRLWRNAPDREPEFLVEEIFDTVIEQLRVAANS